MEQMNEEKIKQGTSKLLWEDYITQKNNDWPKQGNHILAQYDDDSIIVYQAFNKNIAEYAVMNQKFGGPHYLTERMSWIKTNFMWMMFRCGWASKKNQECVLAIRITRTGFDEILSLASKVKVEREEKSGVTVRLQWDPDHDPSGSPIKERRAIQLGLKGQILDDFSKKFILSITDITDKVKEEFSAFTSKGEIGVGCPRERVYIPESHETCSKVGMDIIS